MHSYFRDQPTLLHALKTLERLNPDQFELFYQRRTATKVDSKDQQVDSITRSEDVGLSIRLIKDRRLGFSSTTSLEKAAIERAAENALQVASVMPEDEHNGLFAFGSVVYPHVDNHDSAGLKIPLERKIELAKELEARCRKADARITGIRNASVTESETKTLIVDSNGEQIKHQSTLFSSSITCKAEEGGDSQMGGEYHFSNFLDTLDIAQTARQAAEKATELLQAKNPPTLKCPAILRNNVAADLIQFLSASFSAEEIAKGRSLLGGKTGQQVFSDRITLVDDGLMPGGYGTSPFDGEGIPSRKTVLVDGGTLSEFLYDTYHARKCGAEPTGSSIRGIKSPPSIGFSNLYIENGRKRPAQLIGDISKGVVITSLMGLHTANPVTGDFSLGASGLLIENGKLTRPIRGFAVAGNILDTLRKVVDLGNDLRFYGSVGAPSLRVSELSVGGI